MYKESSKCGSAESLEGILDASSDFANEHKFSGIHGFTAMNPRKNKTFQGNCGLPKESPRSSDHLGNPRSTDSFDPRPTGGKAIESPSFSLISAKLIELATRNFQLLSRHQFYTLCADENFVSIIGWPETMSELRHVLAVLMQNNGRTRIALLDPVFNF